MKIDTKKIKFDEDYFLYKILSHKKCCDYILDQRSIVLNDRYCDEEGEGQYSVKLESIDIWFDAYDSSTTTTENYTSIGYCPFCQEEIKINIIEEVDMTEEFLELKRQRAEKWSLCQKTDSKKKTNKLQIEVRGLDKVINDFYKSDGFEVMREGE